MTTHPRAPGGEGGIETRAGATIDRLRPSRSESAPQHPDNTRQDGLPALRFGLSRGVLKRALNWIMRVSFVLPAYNEERLIGRAISSIIESAAGLDHEIIVADDASEDRTAEIAREAGARVITEHHRQIAATRNAGARAATGGLFVFVDADSAVCPELVRQTIAAVEGGAVGGGARCEFDGWIPLYARVIKAVVFPLYALAGLTPGAYIFATREGFNAAGGFDETAFGGEEVLFARTLRKLGRFTIVRAAVLTSGRKLRTYPARELLGTLARLGVRGRKGIANREGLDLWYAPRPEDPGCPTRTGPM